MKEKIKKSLKRKFLGEYAPSNNKERSLVFLIIGFIVLISLVVIIRINFSNKPVQHDVNINNIENVEYLSIDRLFNNYIDNYKYNIEILDSDILINYTGSIDNNVNTGKRIYNNTILNYQINNDSIVDIDNNQIIDDLYGDYLSYFFVPSNLFDYIKNMECKEEIIDNNKIYNYNNIYEEDEITFKIITTKDRIEEINYNYKNIYYKIELY